jgi:antitoxin MazE
MEATVSKWGNSLGVRIPKDIAQSARIVAGDDVDMRIEGSAIVMRKKLRHQPLKELLKDCTQPYDSEWVDWGEPAGDEIW